MRKRFSRRARRWQWAALVTVGAALAYAIVAHRPAPPPIFPARASVTLTPQDRLLILAPHPDDEVIGCGGLIQQAVAMGLPVRVVFLTYGDNNEWSFLLYRHHPIVVPSSVQRMGLVRHDEALAAAKRLGLGPERLTFLGYPDFGTLQIWNEHWGARPPYRGMLTRVTRVPYRSALRLGAPYTGEAIVQDLTTILREFRPTKIFLSHPADYMPDHRALYLFTRVALWGVAPEIQPALYPYLTHFPHWPRPRGYRPSSALEPPAVVKDQMTWCTFPLGSGAVAGKRAALEAHRTQMSYSANYLLAFVRRNELFGDVPDVFLRPSAGPVPLSADEDGRAREAPEELTEAERSAFVGLEARSVRLEGRDLVLSIECSRPLAETVKASVYLFGYRHDRPFGEMPKLHVRFGTLRHDVYDQVRHLPGDTIQVSRRLKRLTVRVPLEALGDPERVFTSARTYLGAVPLDWVSWRVVVLPSAP